MKTVAIICEYNPLHSGHEYQIKRIKEEFDGARIVAIMSSEFVQRGDVAVFSRSVRAKAAVKAGCDLVLELPFPYSYSSAEYFARAGVYIADAVGVCDALSFGSELGDVEELKKCADMLADKSFLDEVEKRKSDNRSVGHIKAVYDVASDMYGKEYADMISSSNNILALEYIKAGRGFESGLDFHTVRREGDGYNDASGLGRFVSATYLRELIERGEDISSYVPAECAKLYKEAIESGEVANIKQLEGAILAHFRLADPKALADFAEMSDGLEYRLCECAGAAKSIEDFFELAATKKYTNARIRRAVLSSIIGVKENDIKSLPSYTSVLAANKTGLEILKEMKKSSRIPVITKPADYKTFDDTVKTAFELAQKAYGLYSLSVSNRESSDGLMKFTPYIEN